MVKLWKIVTALVEKAEGIDNGPMIIPAFCFQHIIQNVKVHVGRALDVQRPAFCIAKQFSLSHYASGFDDAVWRWLWLRLDIRQVGWPGFFQRKRDRQRSRNSIRTFR